MSLNGLDDPAVVEAHQAALAEAGGWFLLKYATRDTVALLGRGVGGVVETRLALEQYDEKSPLYGLVQYRRKRIILKYVPDGTSRLLQVRLSVQFQSVLEKLIPHDTVFSFTTPAELTESGLSSACMLGTRAGSLKSSSSSLRRRRLNEITEDVEEGQTGRDQAVEAVDELPTKSPDTVIAPAPTPASGKGEQRETSPAPDVSVSMLQQISQRIDTRAPAVEDDSTSIVSKTSRHRPTTPGAVTSPARVTDKSLPALPPSQLDLLKTRQEGETKHADEHFSSTQASNSRSVDPYTEDSSTNKRHSIAESDRASTSVYNPSYLIPKPKKKLGPRPHIESQSRPKTSGSGKGSGAPRPVANLPNSIQVSNRASSVASFRPDSRQSSRSVPIQHHIFAASTLPPLPGAPNVHIAALYKPTHEIRPSQARAQTNPLTPTTTPEKLRLMKALQMRKKNQTLAKRASTLSYMSSGRGSTDVASQVDVQSSSELAENIEPKPHSHSTKPSDEYDTLQDPMSSTASPISMSHVSEKPSTQSSFTTDNEERASRGSISSDTGSSITPKADDRDNKSRQSTSTKVDDQDFTPKAEGSSELKPEDLRQTQPFELFTPDLNLQKEPAKVEPATRSSVETEQATTLAASKTDEFNEDETPRPSAAIPRTIVQESSPVKVSPSDVQRTGQKLVVGDGLDLSALDRDAKRRAILDPLGAGSAGTSDVSDDDSFMDELQHAKVEQAKPMSVARSPATPIYSKGSTDRLRELSRAVSTPMPNPIEGATSPERPVTGGSRSIRSVSSNRPQWPPMSHEGGPVSLAKKGTLSSGISRRIKALEVFTSRDSMTSPPASPAALPPKPSRFNISSMKKRSSFISHQRQPPASTSAAPPRGSPAPVELSAEEPATTKPIPWVQRHGSDTEINAPTQKGESISITARIVRDPNSAVKSNSEDPSEPVLMNLHRSPLIVEQHERHESMSVRPAVYREVSFQEHADTNLGSPRSTRFSFTSHRSGSQTRLHTSDSMASRMSTATKKSSATVPRSMSDNSSFTSEKKESRASRLRKRVSNLSNSSRRNLLGALSTNKKKDNRSVTTITELNENPPRKLSDTESMAHVVDIGDLNVQFPDTLLWKRRFMRIDDQGYVIFSPPTMERNPRGISRKFHLSDFRKPTLPDNEREEMLWSIKLELRDGSCIQCACESKHAQEQVLITLVNAHAAYHSLYGRSR